MLLLLFFFSEFFWALTLKTRKVAGNQSISVLPILVLPPNPASITARLINRARISELKTDATLAVVMTEKYFAPEWGVANSLHNQFLYFAPGRGTSGIRAFSPGHVVAPGGISILSLTLGYKTKSTV